MCPIIERDEVYLTKLEARVDELVVQVERLERRHNRVKGRLVDAVGRAREASDLILDSRPEEARQICSDLSVELHRAATLEV